MNEEKSTLQGALKNEKFMESFLAAQQEITHATQDGKNPHFRSQYATLHSVIDTAKSALNKHGLMFHQVVVGSDSNTVAVETHIMGHGESLSGGPVSVPLAKKDPQGFGSALTYCRRYSLSCAVGIFQKDDDSESAMPRGKYQLRDTDGTVLSDVNDLPSLVEACAEHFTSEERGAALYKRNRNELKKAEADATGEAGKDRLAKMRELYEPS